MPAKIVSYTFSFSNRNNSYVKLFAHLFIICRAQWIQNISKPHTCTHTHTHSNLIAYLYHRYITTKSRHHPNYRYSVEAVAQHILLPTSDRCLCVCCLWYWMVCSLMVENHWCVNENVWEKLNSKPFYKVALMLQSVCVCVRESWRDRGRMGGREYTMKNDNVKISLYGLLTSVTVVVMLWCRFTAAQLCYYSTTISTQNENR